uniref:ANK_REP_REGION domain-containing protein n=1 Tax=Macrostomum lignano TaxID=282301 RepID=A0A1I8HU47_9PLAT
RVGVKMPLRLRLRRSVSSDRGLVGCSMTASASSTTTVSSATATVDQPATGLRRGISLSGISRMLSSSASNSSLSATSKTASNTTTLEDCFSAAVRQNDTSAVLSLLYRQTQKRSLLGSSRHRKINVNCQLGYGMTALHQAAFNGNVPMMQVLLDHGALVDLRDARGLRPLHVASYQGHGEAVHLLLNKGSQPDLPACGGLSPLHLACQAGHYEIVKTLLCSNSDPMLRTEDGRTAFDVACEFGRFSIAQLLLSLKSVSCLLHKDLEDEQRGQAQSCLHLAAKNGHVDVLRLLLGQQGANPNRMTEHGTCLHLAAIHGQLEAVKFLLEVSEINFFPILVRCCLPA